MIVLRRRELALRCALGAPRARLFRSLVTSALRLGVTGTAIGLVASRASASWLGALLYGVDPHAPGVYVLAAGAMLAIVALAAAGSAAAIRRVNPVGALAE
jgi:ABC-type antimicrobial peptide transport system permease subunit